MTFPSFPGLAIDYPESKLYWISSGNGTINRCDLDGSNLEVIESVRSQLSKATALAIMGEGCRRGTPSLGPSQTLLPTSAGAGGDGERCHMLLPYSHRGQTVVG